MARINPSINNPLIPKAPEDELVYDGGELVAEKKDVVITKGLVIAIITLIVFVAAAGLGIGLSFMARRQSTPAEQTITNQPTVEISTPAPEPARSKLATDSAVLRLQTDLTGFLSELDRIDLVESQLIPPNIDLGVKIETP